MSRKMKYIVLFMSMALYVSLFSGCGNDTKSKTPAIQIENPEQISKIQLHTIRRDIKDFTSDKLENLIKDLENAAPLDEAEAKKITANDNKMYISFIYEDKMKDIFTFFKDNNKWYLEYNGNIYADADFLEEYINGYDALYTDADSDLTSDSEFISNIPLELLEKYLETTKNLEQIDLKNYFLFSVEYYQNQGYSNENAISKAKTMFIKKWQIYKEAERLELTPSDDELDDFMHQYISNMSETENFKDYEPLMEKYHTNLDEIVFKHKDLFYHFDISNQLYNFKLYRLKFDEFAAGNDVINGITYDTVRDYYNAYLENEVYSYDLTDDESKQFLEDLNQEEAFCLQQ